LASFVPCILANNLAPLSKTLSIQYLIQLVQLAVIANVHSVASLCENYLEQVEFDNINEKRRCRLNSVVRLIINDPLIYVASHKNFTLGVFTQSVAKVSIAR
jgi:hypothetical protein